MFELKYEENKFGIYLSGPYCRNEIIKNLNNKFGCVINRENNSILFPWGYKVINGIFDSSYEIEFNLLNIYFKHTEGINQIYFFQFNILDENRNLKEKGNFNLTVNYDCYYSCKECDNSNNNICTKCNDDYPYMIKDLGECYCDCLIGYGSNALGKYCVKYNEESYCEKCNEDDINL